MLRKLEFRAAQVRFDNLLDRVGRGEQFVITMHGQPIAKLEPSGNGRRKRPRRGSLIQFFARSPLARSGIKYRAGQGWAAQERAVSFLPDFGVLCQWFGRGPDLPLNPANMYVYG